MTRAEKQEQVNELIRAYEDKMKKISLKYDAKYYLADTPKEILAVQDWHRQELGKANEWYGKKLYEVINLVTDD